VRGVHVFHNVFQHLPRKTCGFETFQNMHKAMRKTHLSCKGFSDISECGLSGTSSAHGVLEILQPVGNRSLEACLLPPTLLLHEWSPQLSEYRCVDFVDYLKYSGNALSPMVGLKHRKAFRCQEYVFLVTVLAPLSSLDSFFLPPRRPPAVGRRPPPARADMP
jgi:hypothetical protein